MRRQTMLFFVFSTSMASWVPACEDPVEHTCSSGTAWICSVYPGSCPGGQSSSNFTVCTDNAAAAKLLAQAKAAAYYDASASTITVSNCFDSNSATYTGMSYPLGPGLMPQGNPSSCLAVDGDDPCVACAKEYCCDAYQACSMDMNCSCLVGCLYQGNTVPACTGTCGTPSSASLSTAACLDSFCPNACENPGGMGSGMCPGTTGAGGGGGGSGSSSSGGPACTPGSGAPGASCFSNTDCASCMCFSETMTCN